MHLGLETFSYHLAFSLKQMNIFNFIERVKQLGLDGLQINTVQGDSKWGHLGGDGQNHLKEVKRLLQQYGLYVELETKGTDSKHLIEALDICKSIGADKALVELDIKKRRLVFIFLTISKPKNLKPTVNDYYPKMEYSEAGILKDTKNILN